jgi:hypothetical protein
MFVLVSLLRENLRGLREKFKAQNPNLCQGIHRHHRKPVASVGNPDMPTKDHGNLSRQLRGHSYIT